MDYTSTLRLTLQSLAAQIDAPFQAISLLDPLCAAQAGGPSASLPFQTVCDVKSVSLTVHGLCSRCWKVGAAHARFQDQQAGWLLLEDALDESLMTLETKHPQLLKRLDAMMELAGRVSREVAASEIGPAVMVAVHYSFRPQKPTDSFCSLLHLLPKANRPARRVFVSWPVGLVANIRAVEGDLKCIKDAEEQETHDNSSSHLCSLHALLQHKSRMGDFDATNPSWLMETPGALLPHRADQHRHRISEERSIDIPSLCKDVLSNSWPANLWAVLPEHLVSDLDQSLAWRSLQQAMQEALQRHSRKRRKRTSRTTGRASEMRMYSLCWRSQLAEILDLDPVVF